MMGGLQRIAGMMRVMAVAVLSIFTSFAQTPSVPSNFKADAAFARYIRSMAMLSTEPAKERYVVADRVLKQLVMQLPAAPKNIAWDIRIGNCAGNMLSSPDGAIFVDEEIAHMLGNDRGLWAAALAHEIVHVVRRDWARRYLFEQSLRDAAAGQIVLDAGGGGSSWMDSRASGRTLKAFAQELELQADAEGIGLMARAGFHPAFMPALFEMMRGHSLHLDSALWDSAHPEWEERQEKLRPHFASAWKEFERLWPLAVESPGGNPPVIASAGTPSLQYVQNGAVRVVVPLHCENLYGALEVVLRLKMRDQSSSEARQYTGCTSKRTLVEFLISPSDSSGDDALISVLDERGDLLTGAVASTSGR